MGKENPIHSKLLTAAARQALRPMGLFQKGRSRTWLDDQRWWVCVVEFQPSSWSRGSYLNVGCTWLWHVKDYVSFDVGYRVEHFCEFHNEVQFEAAARSLAERAGQEVARYRQLFPNVGEVCSYYLRHHPEGFWPIFDAAIACGLAGHSREAQRFLREVTESKGDQDWFIAAQAEARELGAIIKQTGRFRQVIADRVKRTRELQKLSALTSVDFDCMKRAAG